MEKKNHNKLFETAQEKYLNAQNKKEKNSALTEMYLITKELAAKYIKKALSKTDVFYDAPTLEAKVEQATLYVIEQYLRKPDFRIKRITAYIEFGKLKALYSTSNYEQNIISVDANSEVYKESREIKDNRILSTDDAYVLYDELSKIKRNAEQEECYLRLKYMFEGEI